MSLRCYAEEVCKGDEKSIGNYVFPYIFNKTDEMIKNRPLSSYASVPANNNLKSRLRAKFSYICCIFSHEASTSGYCSREPERNSKVFYLLQNYL